MALSAGAGYMRPMAEEADFKTLVDRGIAGLRTSQLEESEACLRRALAIKPKLLLADEPTGNLDEATADEVLALARDLVARSGCGLLMVTHSARLAATLDRQVTLHAGRVT